MVRPTSFYVKYRPIQRYRNPISMLWQTMNKETDTAHLKQCKEFSKTY